jgi:predicted dehydrogenase/Xaa-Pro aminopeptidase
MVWNYRLSYCAQTELIQFSAVYDINKKHAEKIARRYKVNEMKAYDTLKEFLNSDIDAVLIMVPHIYHEDLVIKCASAGKHILCEKPMATTLEGCDRMIDATKSAGVKFMIAENHRFLPAHTYIYNALNKGLLGDVYSVRAFEGVDEILNMSQPDLWKGDPIKAGGGAFMDMAAHKFATLEWLLGEKVESITTMLAKQAINLPEKAEDNAIALLNFSNDIIGEVGVSFTQVASPFNSLEIYGSMGTIIENHMWEKPVKIFSYHDSMDDYKGQWYEPEIEHKPFPGYYNISIKNEDEYFAQCILENKDPEFTPEDAKSAITAILMGYLSFQSGKSVTRKELLLYVNDHGSASILHSLPDRIPINRRLPEVKRMQPIGLNKERAEEIMNRYDLDLLIATSPVNIYYFSGLPALPASPNPILFALSNRYPNLTMMRRDGVVALIYWDLFSSVDRLCWVVDYKGASGQKDVRRSVWSKMKKWGMIGKRIGVESSAPKYLMDHIARKNPDAEIVIADSAIIDLRLIKSDKEILCIEEATRIAEKAITACIDAVSEGMTDNDFLKIARKVIIEEGGDGWDHLTLSIGDSDPEAPGIGTVVKKGDIIRFDFGAVYKGYVSDVNRHVILGDIPDEAKEIIDRLILFQEYYEKRVKPGVNMKQLDEEARAYYQSFKPDGLTFPIGHSIGLECEEAHIFGTMGLMDRPFEKGMVFEIELFESFGKTLIGVEDCYVVMDSDCRKMTTLDKHITSK